jgi:putative ABC transport system permease protein
MGILDEWFRRVEYLVHRSRHEEMLRQEMAAHRRQMTDAKKFGNELRLREDARDVWGWAWLDEIVRDVRFAGRSFVRAPGFSIIAILSLALATGATTAIFSIVHSVLLRPLPFASPDRLVQVREIHKVGGAGSVGYADLQEFRAQSASFERFTGCEFSTRLIETRNGIERLAAVVADREFFTVLGVSAAVGRTFGPDDPPSVAVLSAGVWKRLFDGDPGMVGRPIVLSGNRWDPLQRRSIVQRRELTVVGIMPDSFQFPYGASAGFPGALPENRTEIWIAEDRAGGRIPFVTGRMKPGVTVQAAQHELEIIEKRLDEAAPSPSRPNGVRLTPLSDDVLGAVRRSLWLLFGAVGLVLAAACANIANLLLARTTARTQEVVTRAALGAGPLRLVRQFLVESLALSLAGGLLGVAVAQWGVDLLVAVGAAKIPRAQEIRLDWMAFAFLLTICAIASILFGLAPALIASRADAQNITKEAGGRSTVAGRYHRMRNALVVAEIALAFVLACAAAGVIRELNRLGHVDAGMITDNVITLHLTPRVPDRDYLTIEQRVRALPGVAGAGLIQMVPLQNWGWLGDYRVLARPPGQGRPVVELRTVTPGYFDAVGIPVRGRRLTEADIEASPRTLLVNETLARKHFPGEDPIGQATDRGTIVGVVGDVRQARLDRPVEPEIYQIVSRDAGIATDIGMTLMVRAAVPPESLVPAVRTAVLNVNPVIAIFNVKSMDQVVADSLWELNLYRWLIGMFAVLALALAAIGLYGVIAYSVASRTREFAVRIALGSEPADLARMVLSRGVRLAGLGVGVGVASAFALQLLLRDLSETVKFDLTTLAVISTLLLAITLVACLVPAIRVSAVNPAAALRRDN